MQLCLFSPLGLVTMHFLETKKYDEIFFNNVGSKLAHFYEVISTSSTLCIEKIYGSIDLWNRKSK